MKTCAWILDNDEPCGEICEGRTEYCASHNRQLRKEATDAQKQSDKRKAQLEKAKEKSKQPRKKISKVSPKREEINKEYFKLVEQFKKDNPECKAKVNEYCMQKTEDVHHKKGRGIFLLDVSTFLPCCRSCHSFIEAHPKEAKERGWSSSRLQKENPIV